MRDAREVERTQQGAAKEAGHFTVRLRLPRLRSPSQHHTTPFARLDASAFDLGVVSPWALGSVNQRSKLAVSRLRVSTPSVPHQLVQVAC